MNLTGEDLGYKPSVVEQDKFEYSPLGKIFNKRLDKDEDNKKELLKKLKNIEDKNEEQLQLFSKANKTSRLAKNESDYNYDNNKFAFHEFYRDLENFRRRSLESKYNDISKFYSLLDKFKPHKVITTKTRERKIRVMNNVVKLCNYYFNFYEKAYDKSTLNEKEGCNPKQFKRVDNDLPE